MSAIDPSDYDGQVRAIQAVNQPLLDAFEVWLEQSSLSQKTIETPISNIRFNEGRVFREFADIYMLQ